ncbi:PucR family transcriptional regulator [Marinobacter oulmenensis]|uniref:PucR C-terminal helix-turn-helix domain-containing protein n=1 Tax=Marinobacter oulmenensis TaxID=643747 RepID=A0A840UA08_9GAMM|nr:PucR family transcriptional regulator [Marinobacter oulmenensis]MBB5321959.1 hypothetical protein [Marinobacter oulmenensis]
MPLHCHDMPAIPGLEAIRLRGGGAAADNTIRWPYVAENRSFQRWVKGGELVFVTGISRHRSPENLAECLYEGRECRISGLVVLTGEAYIGQLPNALCRLADELSMPLFEQPYSLPMVEVTEAISRAIVQSEIVGELPPEPGLLATNADLLEAWVTCRGNQRAMADALGCHRNTIRNRMNHIHRSVQHPHGNEAFKTLLLAHLLSSR